MLDDFAAEDDGEAVPEDTERELRQFFVELIGGEAWKLEIVRSDPPPDAPPGVKGAFMKVRGPAHLMKEFARAFAERAETPRPPGPE